MIKLSQILAATRVDSVTDVIQAVGSKVSWKPVGGRDNNLATINLGSDPAAGVTERITNAIDAVLEREWIERGEPTNIRSPREAVELWFGIKDGKMENVDAREAEAASLADRIQVTLRDSSRDDHPTVDVRDYGTGLKSEEFATSILSLNENRKLRKFFLSGAFGQGGSTALSYSQYCIILSRRIHKEGEEPNSVAFAVVRFNVGNLDVDKHGLYEYMVDRSTGQPIALQVPLEEFEPGTLIRHVHMDIGKYNGVITAPTRSLWYLAHHYLFDAVLPYRIVEARAGKTETRRFVGGNHRRLTQGEKEGGAVDYQRAATITFRAGTIEISWWVLSAEGDPSTAKERITNYCLASKPIVITFNGQKQGDLPNTIIKNDLKLPYLDRYLVVHVDCDGLDNAARRQLFSTTRESLRDSSILDDLRRTVTEILEGDEELRRLDTLRKQRYMQRADSQSTESLRRRLANRVKTMIKAGGSGTGVPTPGEPPTSGSSSPKPPIPVQEPPTFLEISTADPKKIYAAGPFRLLFKTDADPSYFLNPDAFIPIISPPSFGQYTGTATVRDGYGVAYFKAGETTNIGDTAEISLELRPNRAKTLSSTLGIEVVETPVAGTGTGSGEASTPNINPMYVGS